MSKKFQTIDSLQKHLKSSVQESIESRLAQIVIDVVRDNLLDKVYWDYTPQGEFSYDRTYELLDSVTVGEVKMGSKYATFEVFMDASKIEPYETGQGEWNQHADIKYEQDVSDYIPMWIEEGTTGSLWDREGAHYMYDSWVELADGDLANALADALRKEGWDVTFVS